MTVRARLVLLALLGVAGACGENGPARGAANGNSSARRFPPVALEGGCPEGSPIEQHDFNRDGVADFVVTSEGSGSCRASDLNFDGTFDLCRHRDSAGNLVREEADLDYDGRLDVVAVNGPVGTTREEFDTNWDGNIDLWVEMQLRCDFQSAPAGSCTTACGIPWCMARAHGEGPESEYSYGGGTGAEAAPAALPVALLYRDSNGDALWDTAEVLIGGKPICVAFNTNRAGDTPSQVRPEQVEVYRPTSVRQGRPDIDYVKRDYLDLDGNPIVRCEDSNGAVAPCPAPCAR